MSRPIKARVIYAGALPIAEWCDRRQRWVVDRHCPEDLPPRVVLDVSEEAARALASHLYREIGITVRPGETFK